MNKQIEKMTKSKREYLKFKPFADDLRKAESWCDLDGVLNRYQTVKNLYKMGYRKQSEGEWTRFEVNSSKGYGQVYYQHKDCDFNATQLFPSPYPYCPNCGARMSGGKSD